MNYFLPLIFVFIVSFTAGANEMKARLVTSIDRIPEPDIVAALHDKDGTIWYASKQKLYHDDGYDISAFAVGDDSRIRSISQDKESNIWIATDKGAYILDADTYNIEPFDRNRTGENPINQVYITSDGSIWLNQYGNLRQYNPQREWVKDHAIERQGNKEFVTGFSERAPGDIFMTCQSNGVYRYNMARETFEMYAPANSDIKLLDLVYDEANAYFWLYDSNGHIYRFNPYASVNEPLYIQSNISHYLTPDRKEKASKLIIDKDKGWLWVITRRHLLAFEPQADGTVMPLNIEALKDFDGAVVQDIGATPGMIWVSSYGKPCSIISLNDNNISFDKAEVLRRRSGNEPIITRIVKDVDSNMLWLLQQRAGLTLYNPSDNRLIDNEENSQSKYRRLNRVANIAPSKVNNGIWLSQWRRGILRAITHNDKEMMQVDSIMLTSNVDQAIRVDALMEDSKGRVWAASSKGLFAFNTDNRTFDIKLPSVRNVSAITEDEDGNIWLATRNNSILKFHSKNIHKLTRYHIPGNFTSILVNPNSNVLLGTDEGKLIEYSAVDNEYREHTVLGDLLHSPILKLASAGDDNVWILSRKQLVEYNPQKQNVNIIHAGHDIEADCLIEMAQGSGDSIIIGVIGGLAYITPSPQRTNRSTTLPHISNITVNGQSAIYGSSEKQIKNNTLKLDADDRNIIIYLSSNDYVNADNIRFAYRLKGFDQDWNTTPYGENKITYSYLPKGRFELEVKASDSNNRWSEPVKLLSLERKPAFHQTWWAITLMVMIAMAVLAYIIVRYRRFVHKENEEMWSDSAEMVKMRQYLESPVSLPDEEFRHLDSLLVSKATEVVEAHLSEPDFDVNELASGCNMSRSSFTRKIKAITNLTPLEFIKDIKMKHARHMLESQNYTVSEVAERLGFANRRYFTASFHKATGVNPSDYLRDKQNGLPEAKNQSEEG